MLLSISNKFPPNVRGPLRHSNGVDYHRESRTWNKLGRREMPILGDNFFSDQQKHCLSDAIKLVIIQIDFPTGSLCIYAHVRRWEKQSTSQKRVLPLVEKTAANPKPTKLSLPWPWQACESTNSEYKWRASKFQSRQLRTLLLSSHDLVVYFKGKNVWIKNFMVTTIEEE